MEKDKKNKLIVLVSGVLVILLMVAGISFAIFRFGETSTNQELVMGDIWMKYTETNGIQLENALPGDEYTNYFEFTITGTNTYTKKDIFYDISLTHGDTPAGKTEENRVEDKYLKFKLTEVNENFELKIKSILALERIDTIKIKAPLNIYYLNMYLNLLKEKNIKLDTKEDEWNTEIIKSRIAELLNTNSMNYDDFVNYITDTKTQEQKNEAEPNDTKEDKPKKKPMYTIAELQKRHLERKRGND